MKEEPAQDIFNYNPIISTTISYLIGLLLIGDLNAQEQNALGNWLMLIAQVLITNAASQNVIQARTSKNININHSKVKSIYNPSFYDIKTLIEVLKTTSPEAFDNCVEIFSKSFNKINDELKNLKN